MSAAVLREAAALMRERANGATQGPWVQQPEPRNAKVTSAGINAKHFDDEIAVTIDATDAEYIASWHPAVALAVADLVDGWLASVDENGCEQTCPCGGDFWKHRTPRRFLAVARAYLGRDS